MNEGFKEENEEKEENKEKEETAENTKNIKTPSSTTAVSTPTPKETLATLPDDEAKKLVENMEKIKEFEPIISMINKLFSNFETKQ